MVPATIITSACRGEGRNTSAPNREMSKRDAPAAIISMAQHASPKVSGHNELARPKASKSSRTANLTIWEQSAWAHGLAVPFENSFLPRVNDHQRQNPHKNQHLDEIPDRINPVINHRHRNQKQHVHRERHKDQRIEVIHRAVANPRVADRIHPALDVLPRLVRVIPRLARRNQMHHRERAHRKNDPAHAEGKDVDQIGEKRLHSYAGNHRKRNIIGAFHANKLIFCISYH
jgi:hypothetical protein